MSSGGPSALAASGSSSDTRTTTSHVFANYTVASRRLLQIPFNQSAQIETEEEQEIGTYEFQAAVKLRVPIGRNPALKSPLGGWIIDFRSPDAGLLDQEQKKKSRYKPAVKKCDHCGTFH